MAQGPDRAAEGNADAALAQSEGGSIEHVVVVRRTGHEVAWAEGRDRWWHELVAGADDWCEPERLGAEEMLYLLYTSGTTARPKGILHTSAGYLLGAKLTHKLVFDVRPDDVYWCAADIGWVTGHSYIVYGPLANHTTGVIYEGAPEHPAWDRHWEIMERHGVTIYYTAPTAIRAFVRAGAEHLEGHDLSTLRLLGTVGEPINPEAWIWYHEHVGGGRCPIVDTWWQTETGAIMISPLPGVTSTKPGSAAGRCPGSGRRGRRREGQRRAARRRRLPHADAPVAGDAAHVLRRRPALRRRPTGSASARACTSPATARSATPTATTGCSAASTT